MSDHPHQNHIKKLSPELWEQISKNLPSSALRSLSWVSLGTQNPTMRYLSLNFADVFLKEEITPPFMHYINSCCSSDETRHLLRQAVLKLQTMRIPITLSNHGHQLETLKHFLANCFPSGSKQKSEWPDVVVTVLSTAEDEWPVNDHHTTQEHGSTSEREPSPEQVSPLELAIEDLYNAATPSEIKLKFNLHIRHDSPIEWDPILGLVEGVDITMAICQALDQSIESSAQYLTLHMTGKECTTEALGNVAAQFPHVHDLRLVLDSGNKSPPGGLHLVLGHLKKLSKLHTLRIGSDIFPHTLEVPEQVRSFVIEGSKFLEATLTRHLKHHLDSLKHLKSVQIRGFHLQCQSDLLRWFPATLLGLDIGSCQFTGSLGQPHRALTEIHVQNIGDDAALLSKLHLQVQTSSWAMLHTTHAKHLRRLYIYSAHAPSAATNDLKDFESLSELWLPIKVLTSGAIKLAESQGSLLKVFPSSLEVLVLSDSEDIDRHGWDFRSLRSLRSLGLQYVAMKLSPSKLPSYLRTIAVSEILAGELRSSLSGDLGFLHIAIMHSHDWARGLAMNGTLTSSSDTNHSEALNDLQIRQRGGDVRHNANLKAELQDWLHDFHVKDKSDPVRNT